MFCGGRDGGRGKSDWIRRNNAGPASCKTMSLDGDTYLVAPTRAHGITNETMAMTSTRSASALILGRSHIRRMYRVGTYSPFFPSVLREQIFLK